MDYCITELGSDDLLTDIIADHEGASWELYARNINSDITLNINGNEVTLEFCIYDAMDAWTEGLIPDTFYASSAEGYTEDGITEYAKRIENYLQEKGVPASVEGYAGAKFNAYNGESNLILFPTFMFDSSVSLQKVLDDFVTPVIENIAPVLEWGNDNYVWKK